MNLLNIILYILKFNQVLSFLLEPSIFQNPPENRIICQNNRTDISNGFSNSEPYLKCSDKGNLKIQKAHLILSTKNMCPLQFSGINSNSLEEECKHPNKLENQDVSEIMKKLCNGKETCYFTWNSMSNLACTDGDVSDEITDMLNVKYKDRNTDELISLVALRFINYNIQALNVTFTCDLAREKFRPFSNKRYDPKFSPKLKNQMRKLSYNRVNRL